MKYGELFKDTNEAVYCKDKGKFSLLSSINDRLKINNQYFEFMITYPEYDDYIYFTQTTNPLFTNKIEDGTVYVKHKSKLTSQKPFKGLALSNNSVSLLDSNGNDSGWFYAIGQMAYDTSEYFDSIPGPNWYWEDPNQLFYEVNLYIKINDWSLLKYLYSFKTCKLNNPLQFHCFTLIYITFMIE